MPKKVLFASRKLNYTSGVLVSLGIKKVIINTFYLNEKIENTQNQISKFNLENYSKTLEVNKIKILDLQKLVSENDLLIDTLKEKLTQLETLELTLTKEKNIAANILNQTNAEINTLSSLLGDDSLNRNTLEKNIYFCISLI